MINLAEYIQLERPLAVLDLETTGVDTKRDRIVQIQVTMHYRHREPIEWKSLVNPGMPIPPDSTEVHKISNEMVKDAPFFSQMGEALARKLLDVDLCGYNILFDLKLLRSEFHRVGVRWWDWEKTNQMVICASQIYRKKVRRRLTDAFNRYGKELAAKHGFEFDEAHDAGADVKATEFTLAGQLLAHDDIPRTVRELYDYCFPIEPGCLDRAGKFIWRNNEACISFGKHLGTPLKKIERKYLEWMVTDGDFPEDTKKIVLNALGGVYPKREP